MVDEIMEEVWRNRDDFARRHNYDLDAMVAGLKEIERQPWSPLIDREKRSRISVGTGMPLPAAVDLPRNQH